MITERVKTLIGENLIGELNELIVADCRMKPNKLPNFFVFNSMV